MQCPVCTDKTLVMSERQGIEIDYCPGCRGVWLDRGELDKIIERSADQPAALAPQAQQQPQQAPQQAPHYPPQHAPYPKHSDDYYRHKRRKSFLEELFD
ncbi:zf-TFIIB domain-containing protein [Viridibacterium curvum]|uniref:Zf-TFIIB domain-containing protein n=1 Tax=Viridibacterium curvum TaxID=1101404 RepID=A0ABP9QNK4_9RHOO